MIKNTSRFIGYCRGLTCGLWLLGAAGSAARAQEPTRESGPPGSGAAYTIRSTAEMILLDVLVQGKNGGFVSGLDESNFQIYEDGQPQRIARFERQDVPVTIGLVVDNSQSMQHKRFEVIGAAISFMQTCNPRDELFVVNFNDGVSLGLPADEAFSSDPERLKQALLKNIPVGRTALYDAVALALKHLTGGQFQSKALVVIADGGDNASHAFNQEEILRLIGTSGATVYTVDLYDPADREHQNPGVLKEMAKISGGELLKPASLADAGTICRLIAQEIRVRYTLGYTSTDTARDGTYRRVRVAVSAPGRGRLQVRTREGYYAPGGSWSGPSSSPPPLSPRSPSVRNANFDQVAPDDQPLPLGVDGMAGPDESSG